MVITTRYQTFQITNDSNAYQIISLEWQHLFSLNADWWTRYTSLWPRWGYALWTYRSRAHAKQAH